METILVNPCEVQLEHKVIYDIWSEITTLNITDPCMMNRIFKINRKQDAKNK